MESLFKQYRVTIKFRQKVMGGIPKDPQLIEGWLRTKTMVSDDDEIMFQMQRTIREMGMDLPDSPTMDDIIKASKELGAERQTNGFKRNDDGLYLEGRAVKAMLKEVTNILYGKDRWGPTRKGAKSYLAERVFVKEDVIPLGRKEPDGVETFMGHVSGPKGPQSTLTYYEYCLRPQVAFTVLSTEDCIEREVWGRIMTHAQENGLGALRSQQHGRFDVVGIEDASPDAPQDWLTKFLKG